jgi:acetyltransferase-like isoleucine patch superfamily enzyme
MSYRNWLVRFRPAKKTFICDETAKLHTTAVIVNNYGPVDAIEIGAHTHIKGEVLTFGHGGKIRIGEYCYVGEQSRIWSALGITIGDRVLISHNVNIYDNSTHPLSAKKRHEQFRQIITAGHPTRNIDLSEQPILISNDAWIGCMSIIMAGVTIGEGAIVGAGSVVTKDVPPYTIVAGNPAKVIREIPADER